LFDWVIAVTVLYFCLFGIGELVLQVWLSVFLLLACGAAAGYFIYWSLSRRGWETLSGGPQKPIRAAQSKAGLQGIE
jgi:hypothetical protein